MNPYVKLCIKLFLYTRIFYISIVIIIYTFNIVHRYDLSSELLKVSEVEYKYKKNILEKILSHFLSYFSSYDAIHFIIIAQRNYINDNIFAFFPFFPWLIRGFARLLSLILPCKNEFIPYMLSGFISSNVFCLANSFLLFSVIYRFTNSIKKAKICVFLFLINPGTIFYISIYSENLYLMLQLIFIFYLARSGEGKYEELIELVGPADIREKKYSYFLELACLIIGLLLTRSNSIILCSYFLIPCITILFYKEKYLHSFFYDNIFSNFNQLLKCSQKVFKETGIFVVLTFHALLCFLYMIKYKPKYNICSYIKKGINQSSTKYNLFYNWCSHSKENKIDSFYNYIQDEYWNVGFLKQYSINSIDRIMLSLPMNILSIYIIYKIIDYFNFPALIKRLNIGEFFTKNNMYYHYEELKDNEKEHAHAKHREKIYLREMILNSFILGGGINFIANFLIIALIAHPQINNRLLSGCPILYLLISDDIIDFIENNKTGNYRRGFLILLFFISFSILGCIMQVGSYGFA